MDINNLQVLKDDPYLIDHIEHFKYRTQAYENLLSKIEREEGSLQNFARGYTKYGFNVENNNLVYREYAPGAKEMYLFGEFNNWDRFQHKLSPDNFGNWEIKFPLGKDGKSIIPHGSRIKVHVLTARNEWTDRIPVWMRRLYQDEYTKCFDGLYWEKQDFKFKNPRPELNHALKIYECHIGMAGIEQRVHTFKEFQRDVLPRIKKLGYNTIQMMAIAEHAYYGSFGYHVTNLFAVSSRLGTPEEFKELIDEAHGMGIRILIDIVHSHASKNVQDGFNQWDGTDYIYFHEGGRGYHDLWDSRLYDYGKWEVLRLLLSNLSWFMIEYNIDGFRFDGITSMLYKHHGNGVGFTGGYHEYFNYDVEIETLVYLMLANKLVRSIYKDAVTIAEDVSGYPTLCRKIEDGGIGFDYRLQMAVPDKWIKLLKENKDDEWDIEDLVWILTNRRMDEKCIVYAESHDQALVGDKTLSMWLFDKEIYFNMSENIPETIIVNRGISLHKMIRLITIALGGEGYLNFMGNEFGHPEWIDFPREGNGWSYQHCIRRWDLVDNQSLRYKYLNNFDMEMIELEEHFKFLSSKNNYVSTKHQGDKVIVFERDDLLFVFNFNPTQSFENYKIGTSIKEEHLILFDTDEPHFGGHDRVRKGHEVPFVVQNEGFNNRPYNIHVYLPARCAMILTSVQKANQYWKIKKQIHT